MKYKYFLILRFDLKNSDSLIMKYIAKLYEFFKIAKR
jgi:hypothetical protein